MAEALFNYESNKRGNGDEARSAGLRPYSHITNDAVEVMSELGIDISSHTPKGLSTEMVDWADKIILLDRYVKDELINIPFNEKDDIIVWDIEDPFNTSKDNFRRVRDLLHKKILELPSN